MKTNSKLDEDFPALSSLLKSTPPQSPQNPPQSPPQQKNPPEVKQYTLDEQLFHDVSPEQIALTDMTTQDFGFALSSSLDFIPDTPYEKDPSNDDGNSDTSYPKTPNMKLLQPEFFKKYDVDTLFFIFFYFPGTSQQYFAGKELHRRGWVFHKNYGSWFLMVGEPTESNAEYTVGKFDYLDHTSESWNIRSKSNFKIDNSIIEQDY